MYIRCCKPVLCRQKSFCCKSHVVGAHTQHAFMISFLSQLSHFYALTLKHSTLIYSHSCYSHRSWLPVHTLFSITSLSFVSHFFVPLYVSEEKLVYTLTKYCSLLCVFKLRVRGCFLVYEQYESLSLTEISRITVVYRSVLFMYEFSRKQLTKRCQKYRPQ